MGKAQTKQNNNAVVVLTTGFLTNYVWIKDEDRPELETNVHAVRRRRGEFCVWKAGRYIRFADDAVKRPNRSEWLCEEHPFF